ncbi:UDP-glucose/GDP-mannose dehydrogenase family protein [Frankia sp. R82]|uniref:UDP-glucose dehydrogenase family protein n=1 Tax=Frankia sp. R82 TaxID=2950553 RepID=UPI002043BAD2|nr:UDP-glucose/GDP-mannose dehydrogenase family protein [Frankia sp. R82]MCM3884520.1 UDP-glucose/GDP-mannose dehydrogenase family protein [Frankia sp. R82]
MHGQSPPPISVIGTGYLGATHAVCMAELGFEVLGVDIDAARIRQLSAGEAPFYEPGLAALLRSNLEAGRLAFTRSIAAAVDHADVHFICVGTPQRPDTDAADLRHVDAVVSGLIAAGLGPRALVVGKSTVPVGTAARLAARITAAAPGAELAWNPEFLREGFAVEDTLRPDRLVFGVAPDGRAEAVLRALYARMIDVPTPVVVTDYATAELVKVAANAFLATKISFINAMSEVCDATGADVVELAGALAHDDRIGPLFLRAGIGYGGGCLPKDVRAFQARAQELGVGPALSFLGAVDAVNVRARARAVELTHKVLGGDPVNRAVAVLGAAFKPNSDDIRDSPALDVATALRRAGAHVAVYDPAAAANARARHPTLHVADSVIGAVAGAEVVLVLTEWTEFGALDPAALRHHVARPVVIDGRGVLDPARWEGAGWTYLALGRPPRPAAVRHSASRHLTDRHLSDRPVSERHLHQGTGVHLVDEAAYRRRGLQKR